MNINFDGDYEIVEDIDSMRQAGEDVDDPNPTDVWDRHGMSDDDVEAALMQSWEEEYMDDGARSYS